MNVMKTMGLALGPKIIERGPLVKHLIGVDGKLMDECIDGYGQKRWGLLPFRAHQAALSVFGKSKWNQASKNLQASVLCDMHNRVKELTKEAPTDEKKYLQLEKMANAYSELILEMWLTMKCWTSGEAMCAPISWNTWVNGDMGANYYNDVRDRFLQRAGLITPEQQKAAESTALAG